MCRYNQLWTPNPKRYIFVWKCSSKFAVVLHRHHTLRHKTIVSISDKYWRQAVLLCGIGRRCYLRLHLDACKCIQGVVDVDHLDILMAILPLYRSSLAILLSSDSVLLSKVWRRHLLSIRYPISTRHPVAKSINILGITAKTGPSCCHFVCFVSLS